jgi:hypothetical protein
MSINCQDKLVHNNSTIFFIQDLLQIHQNFLGKLKLACRKNNDVGSAISTCFVKDVSIQLIILFCFWFFMLFA